MKSIIKTFINFDLDIEKNKNQLLESVMSEKILVIGGAGTIGSSYIKQILKYKPSKITIVDINENGLTELTRDLRSSNLLDYNPEYITYPVNLSSETFDKIFNSESWQVVANFSAHKHVRSEKDEISVEALIKNNVYGAIKLLKLCEGNQPKYFFSVSTDKAALKKKHPFLPMLYSFIKGKTDVKNIFVNFNEAVCIVGINHHMIQFVRR